MTDDETEEYEMLFPEGMSADEIEAMELSRDRLIAHANGGELVHLTDAEIVQLMQSAFLRDMHRMTIRED